MASRKIERKLANSRLLKNYGSWLYCTSCNKTVAYVCYTTYRWIRIKFQCNCGSSGCLELKEEGFSAPKSLSQDKQAILINNRYRCSKDKEPFFSVVSKQIKSIKYEVVCLKCEAENSGVIDSN